MHFTFFQPDIPQNLGAALRLAACFSVDLHVIEPCGFLLTDKRIRQSGLDYTEQAHLTRHASWKQFLHNRKERNNKASAKGFPQERIILFSTRAQQDCYQFSFQPQDMLLFGRESAGVPQEVYERADAQVSIPINKEARSLNLVIAAAIGLGEALRQTGQHPSSQNP